MLDAFRAEARAWLEANAEQRRGARDGSNGLREVSWDAECEYFERCRTWQRTLFDGGWAGITWPVEHGGRGGMVAEAASLNQEQASFDASSGFLAVLDHRARRADLCWPTAPPEQCGALPPTPAPRRRGVVPAVQRARRGVDLANLRTARSVTATRGRRRSEGVESGARYGDWGILLGDGRRRAEASRHHVLARRMQTPGIDVRPLRQITGATHFNEVFLEDVRVPYGEHRRRDDAGWARSSRRSQTIRADRRHDGARAPTRLPWSCS